MYPKISRTSLIQSSHINTDVLILEYLRPGKFFSGMDFLLAHLSTECSVSYCDHSPSVIVCLSVRHPSVQNFLVNTLASTNINQSALNLVIMYMTMISRMRCIMELIGPEMSELSALELENLPYLTLLTL